MADFPVADPAYLENLYALWRNDPGAVNSQWHELFADLADDKPRHRTADMNGAPAALDLVTARTPAEQLLINAYRMHGHLQADINPLGPNDNAQAHLTPKTFGLDAAAAAPLAGQLRQAYCGTLSAEFMHLDDAGPRDWLAHAMESGTGAPAPGECTAILDELLQVECFEQFMQVKFPASKRYGMEGSESQLPLVEQLLRAAATAGVDDIVIGPMHRGRTTFMATVMQKPLPAVFAEFGGTPWQPDSYGVAGDVTYHMGWSADRVIAGRNVHISMASHPSHIETVIPVALGSARARRMVRGTENRNSVLGVMMHTDAGFAVQGIVAECFQLSGVTGYETGGSIHIVANNQVGFTTNTRDARTSRYCSDMGKIVQAPVLHVNGNDPEAAFRAANIAFAFWAKFHRDIIIDLVCYRTRGHNELDEPRYTQPEMYSVIDKQPSPPQRYAARLRDRGDVSEEWIAERRDTHRQHFEDGFAAAQTHRPNRVHRFAGRWSGLHAHLDAAPAPQPDTGVDASILREVGTLVYGAPDGFALHANLARQFADRRKALGAGAGITWAAAELMAFGTLLREGAGVRLTGEDCRRGTFSQRHAVLFDQNTGEIYTPLAQLAVNPDAFEIHDSPLSEEAVLAFEYGLSLADPRLLVVWEAQFGDFANVAQPIIDQYIASGEEKWLMTSGLVLLLPHGMEGGGPEHSSARLERFLQLCAKGNLQVVNCTTPANHFHTLRRQLARDYRKPLVAMTPKRHLRHRDAVSDLAAMAPGTRFQPVLGPDPVKNPKRVSRILLCSGRIFYELNEFRAADKRLDTEIIRLEELYPFPSRELSAALEPYRHATVVWCQEEPSNMGAWNFVDRRLEAVLRELDFKVPTLEYAGRDANPSPAPGTRRQYECEQADVIAAAFG